MASFTRYDLGFILSLLFASLAESTTPHTSRAITKENLGQLSAIVYFDVLPITGSSCLDESRSSDCGRFPFKHHLSKK
ncbi:hypothetical protein F5Y08DRAFT_193377 [Xylaria arbuscula]|nr:hypothetical protein F5Y08DRAFT_193377 [Xylaria arbuscula]